jgi:hypothetical protein
MLESIWEKFLIKEGKGREVFSFKFDPVLDEYLPKQVRVVDLGK